jgi:hypothetical protein
VTIAAVVSSRGRHKCLYKWHEPSLPMTIGAGQMDPFKTHPATKAPDVDVLLSHCRHPAGCRYRDLVESPLSLLTNFLDHCRSINIRPPELSLLYNMPYGQTMVAFYPIRQPSISHRSSDQLPELRGSKTSQER